MRINSQRLVRVVTMPMMDGYRRLRRYLNPNGFSSKVIGDVRKGFRKMIGAKTDSLDDYVAFPRYYVAKKLLFVIALLVIVLPILYIQFLHPIVRQRFFTVPMYINAHEMVGYTGKVKLLSPTTDQVLYEGPLDGGRVTGQGVLWDQDGRLVYQGGFLMEMYDGEGELYYPDGQTMYKGAFVKNQFEGAGYYYYPNGALQYEGSFAKNAFHGAGRLYDPSGRLIYNGGFVDGKQEGQGVLYENGKALYQGQLAAGQFNGPGKIYSGEMVFYDGLFKDNQYEGAGKAFDPVTAKLYYDGEFSGGKYNGKGKLFDPRSGNLLYDGYFYNDAYEGEGKLYDANTGYLLYEGGFRMGRFDGQGVSYDRDSGLKVYEGGYLLHNYSGRGILYDSLTGMVEAEGVFREGKLVFNVEPDMDTDEDYPWFPWDILPDLPGRPEDWPADMENGPGRPETGESGASDAAAGGAEDGGTAVDDNADGSEGKETGAIYYSGPKTDKGIDYQALSRMGAEAVLRAFSGTGLIWDLDGGSSRVFEDLSEKIGVTIQINNGGELVGVDVWNDADVLGIRTGMTMKEITDVLGPPAATRQEALGEQRMVSVSQSNRFHNRYTNVSAESQVEVSSYPAEGGGGMQVVFLPEAGDCLLIEMRNR
jgi:hypothetical protein